MNRLDKAKEWHALHAGTCSPKPEAMDLDVDTDDKVMTLRCLICKQEHRVDLSDYDDAMAFFAALKDDNTFWESMSAARGRVIQ
jgi:hypothetical protein